MAKNKNRWKIQLAATIASNPFLSNFFQGKIHRGKLKSVCVPGLNCYSCPAAAASCPIAALQAVIGSSRFQFACYEVDRDKCIACGACSHVCKMDVDVFRTPNHTECIRCGDCIRTCPLQAITKSFSIAKKVQGGHIP